MLNAFERVVGLLCIAFPLVFWLAVLSGVVEFRTEAVTNRALMTCFCMLSVLVVLEGCVLLKGATP